MERKEYFKMVKSALTTLKPTRGSFFGIWCYINEHFRITNETKAYRHVKEIIESGVKDGTFHEYICRGQTRYQLNIDKKVTAVKSRTKARKVRTKAQEKRTGAGSKSPHSSGKPDIRANKRKKSSASSSPKKKIKSQIISSMSATVIEETQSVSR